MKGLRSLSKAEATVVFQEWTSGLDERVEKFCRKWAGEGGSDHPDFSFSQLYEAMEWVAGRIKLVPEVPDDPDLPIWVAPGPSLVPGGEPDPETYRLFDGIAGFYTMNQLTCWPGSRLFLHRSARHGDRDLDQNAWAVEGPRGKPTSLCLLAAQTGGLWKADKGEIWKWVDFERDRIVKQTTTDREILGDAWLGHGRQKELEWLLRPLPDRPWAEPNYWERFA